MFTYKKLFLSLSLLTVHIQYASFSSSRKTTSVSPEMDRFAPEGLSPNIADAQIAAAARLAAQQAEYKKALALAQQQAELDAILDEAIQTMFSTEQIPQAPSNTPRSLQEQIYNAHPELIFEEFVSNEQMARSLIERKNNIELRLIEQKNENGLQILTATIQKKLAKQAHDERARAGVIQSQIAQQQKSSAADTRSTEFVGIMPFIDPKTGNVINLPVYSLKK